MKPKYFNMDPDLDVVIPIDDEIFTSYTYWSYHEKKETDFNQMLVFTYMMYMIYTTQGMTPVDFENNIDELPLCCHHPILINNILRPTMETHVNFKDMLTIVCGMVLKYTQWMHSVSDITIYEISKRYTLSGYEVTTFNRIKKNFEQLFKVCHVHLYNVINKKVSESVESGRQVCETLNYIFNFKRS